MFKLKSEEKKNRQYRSINKKEDRILWNPTFFSKVTEINKPQMPGVGRTDENAILHIGP